MGVSEHNSDSPLVVGLPSWDEDKNDIVTLGSNNTFNLASTNKSKIAIRVDNNIVVECIKEGTSYKIVEINGRKYSSVSPSNYLTDNTSYMIQDVTEYCDIIRFEENNGLDLW